MSDLKVSANYNKEELRWEITMEYEGKASAAFIYDKMLYDHTYMKNFFENWWIKSYEQLRQEATRAS